MRFEYEHSLSKLIKSIMLLLHLMVFISIVFNILYIIYNINWDLIFYIFILLTLLWFFVTIFKYYINPERSISINNGIIIFRIRKNIFWWEFKEYKVKIQEFQYYIRKTKSDLVLFNQQGKLKKIWFEFPEKLAIESLDHVQVILKNSGLTELSYMEGEKLLKKIRKERKMKKE